MAKFSLRMYLHGYCRWAYKILWGSQSTSDLRIFRVRKPISVVKTPKTSTSASAANKQQFLTYFANNRLYRQLFPIISPSVFLIRILVPFLFPLSISSILVLIISISIFISVLLLMSIPVLISVFFIPASTSVPFSTPTSTVRSISVFLLSIFSVP